MQKERSGFMSMAIGLVIIILGVSIAEFNYFEGWVNPIYPGSQIAGPVAGGIQTNQVQIAGSDAYQNTQYGFSVQYPNNFTLTQQADGGVNFKVPAKNYFRTVLVNNDNNIKLVIPAPLQDCPEAPQGGANGVSTTTIVSPAGVFQKVSGSDAGAGQLYDQSLYTLKSKGLCFAIQLTLHSTNGAGFYYNDQTQIAAVDAQHARDKAALMKVIDQMVSTFRFTR